MRTRAKFPVRRKRQASRILRAPALRLPYAPRHYDRGISSRFYLSAELGGGAGSDRSEASINDIIDRKEALQTWLTELSESQRQTLHLFFYEGYTFEEIAAQLGQTVGNARNHYYRGLQKLRKQISAGKLPGKEAV